MLALLQKLGIALTYPPTLSLCLMFVAAIVVLSGRRRSGGILMAAALAWSLLWSVPSASDWLRGLLEQRYPVRDEASLPRADAVVVLGGASRYAWLKRAHVRPEDLESSRLAAGARAWLAGRAPYVVLSGGGENGISEAGVMAKAIARLGVPRSALILEDRSHSTYENAVFTAALAPAYDIRCVLLVTSAVHMPRASVLFRDAGLRVVPVPVPEHARRLRWRDRWVPSRSALWRSGRAFKEFAGLFTARLRN